MRFSLDSYRALIRTAQDAGYSPAGFHEKARDTRTLLLRHDIDYSLAMAVALGRVNAELGVAGTFFVLLRGHSYNALSKSSLEHLEELVLLGQHLGLHVPAANEDTLATDFRFLLSQVALEPVFAWHNPTASVLEKYREHETVEGLTNVYSKRFLDDALYSSDSNFGRSYDELTAALNGKRSTVHLLVHPINWVAGGASMIEVFEHAWPYLIRECELEARTNRAYAASLPNGMPDSLLTEFSRRWRKAAE
jgi:hypothetical protein